MTAEEVTVSSRGRGSRSSLTCALFAAVLALLALGAAVATASDRSVGLTAAFEGGSSAKGLDPLAKASGRAPASLGSMVEARRRAPASLAKRRGFRGRHGHWWQPPAAPGPDSPTDPGTPDTPSPGTPTPGTPAPGTPTPGTPAPGTDTEAPETSITGGPEASTTATAASFVLASSEPGSTFECQLDGGEWEACTSPKAYAGLTVGAHAFSARASDAAGNEDPTPAAISWTVAAPEPPDDTSAPETTVVSGPPSSTSSNSASFTFGSSESGSSFACKLDSGGWRDCNSPKAYAGLTAGPHRFSVRAADPSGNVDTSPATYDWTIEGAVPPPDTVPPNTSITVQPPASTTSHSASFGFAASETGATFECKLDDGAWLACTPPQAYESVPEGEHEFLVRATDRADNVDGTPASAEWTVEAETAPPIPQPAGCTATVSSVAAAQSALSAAASGAVVCLSGSGHGRLALDADKARPGVTVRAATPGQTTIAGASLSGSNLTLARFVSSSSITVQPGSSGMTIEHNRVTGGGQGIDVGPTSTTTINDTKVIGNELIGPFGEDAIHLNRYHDGDGDGVGILIEGNEITNVRENGNHSDCLQTVWVGDHIVFRENYLHDNRCQGFFVKDQASLGGVSGPINGITVENNLFVRNKEPCGAPLTSCGQPMYFQVFGPYTGFTMRRNTIWGDGVDSIAAFREGTGADSVIADNVIYRLWTDTNMSAAELSDNTVCKRETASGGSWEASRLGETTACSLSFANAAADDYRLSGSDRGVDWAPAERQYGP